MNASFMYHNLGIREQECTREEYQGGKTILHIRTKKKHICCPQCGSRHITCSGKTVRDIRGVPIGSRQIILRMSIQRVECKECGCIRNEEVKFTRGKRRYTRGFERLIHDLSKMGTISDVARFLDVSWDTVKDVQKEYLGRHYGHPSLKQVRRIGIDEFAVAKGHVYMTIVVDMDTGRVIYVGDGKGADALDGFWDRVKRAGCSIESVATDLSQAFVSSVQDNLPGAALVFDHFHVVKLMNDKLDKIRRATYQKEHDENSRRVVRGQRWILLCNGEELDESGQQRLQAALQANRPLAKAYYLKEALRRVWRQRSKEDADAVLADWIRQASESDVAILRGMADTIVKHRNGILAWYDHRTSTGKIEGINNKIKTMKRQAYGFRDMDFFKLKILSLHDSTYAFSG